MEYEYAMPASTIVVATACRPPRSAGAPTKPENVSVVIMNIGMNAWK